MSADGGHPRGIGVKRREGRIDLSSEGRPGNRLVAIPPYECSEAIGDSLSLWLKFLDRPGAKRLLTGCLGADHGRRGIYLIEKRMDRSKLASCKQFRQVATTIYLPLRHGGDGSAQAVKVDPRLTLVN
jgi:hypothetical protein